MFEVRGKYGEAKIFTDIVEDEAISQAINLLNQPYVENSTVRFMPDIHAGAGCTVGTTMTITDKVCPNLVGVDEGCGLKVVNLGKGIIDFNSLDNVIRRYVPSGFDIRDELLKGYEFIPIMLNELKCKNHVNLDKAEKSLGTLGGGNHFIEIDTDGNNNYLVIHSGSRHLGFEVCKYYQKQAIQQTNKNTVNIEEIICNLKAAHRESEIENAIKEAKANRTYIPDELTYITGDIFDDYIHDMKIIQKYASWNRTAMADMILKNMNLVAKGGFDTIHNYIDTDNMILRKGSISAQDGEVVIIPMNMRDGSLICTGKGNPDWNYSAPHGAGRVMSRRQAKEVLNVEDFQRTMSGIYTTSANRSTLDEAPMAYKRMEDIIDNIEPTVEINEIIKPVYNFKAGERTVNV